MKFLTVLLGILCTAPNIHGYNILCIQNVPSKSHYHLMKGLVYPLLEAGHQVTWITTYPDTKPVTNLTYIDVSPVLKLVEHIDMTTRPMQGIGMIFEFAGKISRTCIETPAVREALANQQFDAVISEWFFTDVEAGYAAVQQAPWILLSGVVMHSHMEYLVETVRSVPVIPALMTDYGVPMNLWQRIKNTFSYLYLTYNIMGNYATDKSNYELYFGPLAKARGVTLPPYGDALHNVSILFVNSHPSFAPAQPTPPNVVDIAGYHIDEKVPPLPKDLQELLDSSPRGVVYFSMGSVLKSAALPAQTRESLIQMFSELPYTVLWKFEEQLEGLPKNLHIRPWMPQSSILSHPNVKVFVTHGGLLSTLESLHFGVPLVAVPVFGDQPANALRAVREGRALRVDYGSAQLAGQLGAAVREMLTNDSYYKRAKELSRLFRARPVSSRRLIQHYVELAIESKGAHHLRSKSRLYSWYQLWMLDQLALLVLAVYVAVRLCKKILRWLTNKAIQIGGKKKKN